MSWSPAPGNAGGYGGYGGGSWGAVDLRAIFSGTNLYLLPNTNVYAPGNNYWVNADGSGANIMDANFYVQDDSLAGQNVTFIGSCLSNSLAVGYSSQAFIKLFDAGFGYLGGVYTNLVEGQSFTVAINSGAAAHVQYGFETIGADANPATANALGGVVVSVQAPTLNVNTDPAKFWAGYMAWYPVDGGSLYGGYGAGGWGVADLRASFATTNLYLAPNTNVYSPGNVYWVNTDTGAGANIMTASCYVTDDAIVNTNVTFSGYCRSNTLTGDYSSRAFIKIFNGDYSANLGSIYSDNLASGQAFLINLDTTGAVHVQYGYETVGPDANPATADSLGKVVLATSAAVVPPPVLAWPTNNAATPSLPSGSVLAMFDSSGVYANSPGIGWYASWGSVTSQGDYTITNTSTVVKKYAGLQYAGMEFYGNPINVTAYNTFHIDVWTPNANQLGIKLVSLTGGTQDPQVNVSAASGLITTNHWVGLDIPLSAFATAFPGWDPSNLQQMLLVDNSSAGTGVQGGTFYVDNVYFYTAAASAPNLSTSLSGGNINLSFSTQSGTSYTVQYKTNLTDSVWLTLTNFNGDGLTKLIQDPANQKTRFYRLSVP